jgi:hypothetical protein
MNASRRCHRDHAARVRLAAGDTFRKGRGGRPWLSVTRSSNVRLSSALENVMVLPSGAMNAHMSTPVDSLMIHWTGWTIEI